MTNKNDSAAAHEGEGKPKLSASDVDAVNERLYDDELKRREQWEEYRREILEQTKQLCPQRTLTAAEEEALIKRLYTDAMAHRIETLKQLEATLAAEDLALRGGHRTLSREDAEVSATRMCDEELRRKEQARAEILQSLRNELLKKNKSMDKKIPSAAIKASVERLSQNHREEVCQKIYDEVYKPIEPRVGKIQKDRIKEVADRMSTKA